MAYAIQTYNLSKRVGGHTIVDNLNMNVKAGEIYAFLGGNGSGKTSTLKMIANLWKPTSGRIEVFGKTIQPQSYDYLQNIGSIIEYPSFYDRLSARQNLEIHKKLSGYEEKGCIDHALKQVDLTFSSDNPVSTFSLGMKQRLGLARAIMTRPSLLLLDEPINGLDPGGIKEIRSLLIDLAKQRGLTIVISSHILSELEHMASTVGIIHRGRMLNELSYKMISEMNRQSIEFTVDDGQKAAFLLHEKLGLSNFTVVDPHTIRIYERLNEGGKINGLLSSEGVEVRSMVIKQDTLEDYFFAMIGKNNTREEN
ncbi:bacitracin ABC transporter ATP-binding protein [Paenibacillus elgii]|uniref:Bacitracin ABC transporter ATP-binding protein n=1 Tax=Paenibacillus elgii TaxID=189691 RepID=A0A161S2N8_9BACL|nr:ABC transporter ATP-binding protein [Paenibacillus elgii]KZE78614.1 bacitracin ABC transporter ATP-binding protein [Paenibacillus elgii]